MATLLTQLGSQSPMGADGTDAVPFNPIAGMRGTSADPLVRLWSKRGGEYDAFAQTFQPDWTRYWRYYRAWRQQLSEPLDWWRSNEVIPTCFKIIETLVPKYVFGLFDSPDWFTVKGTEPTDEIWELAIAGLLHEQLEEMHIIPGAMEAIKYAAIMGHVWGKVVWKEEFQTRQILEPKLALDGDLGIPTGPAMQKTTLTQKIADRPDFQWVTLDRIKTTPDGSGTWFIEEIRTTREQLKEDNKRLGGIYRDLDKITGIAGSNMSTSPWFREPEATEGISQNLVETQDGTPVVLWQCWGWVPPQYRTDSESDWRLTVIANRGTVIRDVDAPTPDGKPPYFPIKCIPIPGRLFGDSLLKYVGPLADQQTRLSNHRMDEVMLRVWGQLIIDNTAGITNNEMLFQPGGVLFVQGNPSEKVMVFPRAPFPQEAYREDEYRQEQAEHAAGDTDIMQGVNDSDRSTAQEINAKLTQSGMRITAQVLWFEEMFKKPLLTRVYQWLQMRMPAERLQRIIASDGIIYDVPLNIQNIQIPVDIVVAGGMLGMSKNSRLADFQEMVGLGANPAFAPYMRIDEILREYYRTKGIRAVDRFVKSADEVAMEMAGGMGIQGLGSGQAKPGGPAGPAGGAVDAGGQFLASGQEAQPTPMLPAGGR
jgi:hypothetical protein